MVNVRDFGAVGEGTTKDTAAIQKALDKGGTVVVPPGTYLSGTLYLRDNTELHLEPGATLLASPDPADYNADDYCVQNRVHTCDWASGAHFITAVEARNVAITGTGKIDGNRQAFFEIGEWNTPIKWRPGQMIFLCECRDVTLADVELTNYPYWCCFNHGSEYVTVRGLRVHNDRRVRNSDGLDFDCCRFVTVSDCHIDTGDDCITFRAVKSPLKTLRACEHVTVANCTMSSHCNAIRLGVGGGNIRDILFSNISIFNTPRAVVLTSSYALPTGIKSGVEIEDVSFDHLNVECARAFSVLSNARGRIVGPAAQPIRRIAFNHVRGTFCVGSLFQGYAPGDIEALRFDDVELTGVAVAHSKEYSEIIGDKLRFEADPAYGYFEWFSKFDPAKWEKRLNAPGLTDFDRERLNEIMRSNRAMTVPPEALRFGNVRDAVLNKVRINWQDADPGFLADVGMETCSGFEFRDCRFEKGTREV